MIFLIFELGTSSYSEKESKMIWGAAFFGAEATLPAPDFNTSSTSAFIILSLGPDPLI